MNTTVVSDVFQNPMDETDDAALAPDVARRARVTGRIFGRNQHRVADLIFAVGEFHSISQSGLTLGASCVAPNFTASFCCEGSSA